MLFYKILVYTVHGKILKIHKKNKCKISAPAWNEEFELTNRSYSISSMQYYFEYLLIFMKKTWGKGC